jgi:hypothetical protein
LILPATNAGSVLRAHFDANGSAGKPLTVLVQRGATSLNLYDSLGGIAAVGSITPIAPDAISIIGARQDLNLEPGGHKVSVLWNRPVSIATSDDWLKKFCRTAAASSI